ncbi:MAG: right-handed parallel beta-helix repeat-containing protein [Tannerellaceae bacterium]|jgi:hypothetical protein|nr:right-handed parallel beta-helix repeat-containing protein [Tannerellaceae bacterium]
MGKVYYALICTALLLSCHRESIVYVAPDGDDRNAGTQEQPLKSLERAKNAVRTIRSEKPRQRVTVCFKGGVYPLEQTVAFTPEDSGEEQSPVVYKAMEGETPVFTGSKALGKWTVVDDASELAHLSPSLHGKIYVTDLPAAGITDYGDPTDKGKRPELICNGQLQTLARWPDDGFVRAGRARGATALPENYTRVHGTKEGVFSYLDSYQDRWASEPDIRLGGYWYWDWSDEFQKVDLWDTSYRIVFLSEPYHNYGYKDSLRYFGLNLFCEIDQPGEWYLNRTTGKLYWYPPQGVDLSTADIALTCFNEPYMIEINDCAYLTLEGLTFRESRGSAILITGGKNNRLSGCRIERFGVDGVHITGGTGHGVSGCFLSTFGYGGLKIEGGDRKTLEPGGHFVEHTVVEHFSLFKRTYEPAIRLEGCGMRIANNRLRYSSSSAMRLEGNDLTVEYNEVSHVVNESDDQGALDMWYNPSYRGNVIRYNRWSDIAGGTRHGAAGIRFDDMISGTLVYGNLFERCGAVEFGAVQIHGGKENRIENNVFYRCLAAVSFSSWGEKRWLEALENPVIRRKLYEEVDIFSDVYLKKYPELKDLRQNVDANTITGNLVISCEKTFIRMNDRQTVGNNTEVDAGDKAIETFCTPEVLATYGLQPIPVGQIGPKNNIWL